MYPRSLKKTDWFLFLLYSCCYCVVLLYVNTFSIWSWTRSAFGVSANYFPIFLTGLLLLTIGWYYTQIKKQEKKVQGDMWLYLSLAFTVCAFFLPDPDYPVKRIHVVQYFLLTFLVRYPLSHRVQGNALTFYTFLVTLLFGVHDELIQGVHPLRTYGLRDIMVNGCAALAGSLFTHFISLYSPAAKEIIKDNNQNSRGEDGFYPATVITLLILMIIAVIMYLIPLAGFRNNELPYWLLSPLMGTLVAWRLFLSSAGKRGEYHGLIVLFWLLFLLPVYQVIANVSPAQFN